MSDFSQHWLVGHGGGGVCRKAKHSRAGGGLKEIEDRYIGDEDKAVMLTERADIREEEKEREGWGNGVQHSLSNLP